MVREYVNGTGNTTLKSICAEGWNNMNARVACRELGYSDGIATFKQSYGNYTPAATDVNCTGYESRGGDCYRRELNDSSVCPSQLAGVNCSGNVMFSKCRFFFVFNLMVDVYFVFIWLKCLSKFISRLLFHIDDDKLC